MNCEVISSKILVDILKDQAKQKVKEIKTITGKTPSLTIILAGDNPASASYVKKKIELARDCGMTSEIIYLDNNSSDEYDKITTQLNNDKDLNGFMLQLPCPIELNNGFNINTIKDVDCLEEETYKKMLNSDDGYMPCTPLGVLRYLEFLDIDVNNTNIAIIGRSRLVGEPLALLLDNMGANVTVCHSQTPSIKEAIKNCKVVISVVGKHGLLNNDIIQEGQILIDVGINKVNNKLVGDCDDTVKSKASIITPVPGGVGPLTVMSLITNSIDACYIQNNLEKPIWKIK